MFLSQLSLSVLTLSVTIRSTIGAALPVLSTTESESLIFSENNPNSKEIGDIRCVCVLYFLCDRENVVVWPTSDDDYDQNECTHDFVCCKTPNTELPPTTRRPSQENSTVYFPVDSGEKNVTEEVTTSEATTEDGIIGQVCQCVLPQQCQPENVIELPFVDIQNQCQGESVCCMMNSTSLSTPQAVEPNELECECVTFYLCSTEDLIDIRMIEDQCPISEVCCKKSNSTSPITETIPSNDTKVVIYGISDENNEEKLECECMPFYLCPTENFIELPTTYNNKDRCSNVEVCCKKSKSTPPVTSKPVEPTTPNNTNKVITYGVTDDYYPKDLKCECVVFYLCPEEDVIELTTTFEKDRCSDSNVCCKTPDFISLPTPPPPQPEPSEPSNSTKEIVYGVSDDDEPTELKCKCVPFFLCDFSQVILLPTTYNDKDTCSDSDVCCKMPLDPPPSSPQLPESTPSNNKTKEVVICGVNDDDEPEELDCECVPFYLCPSENVIELPKNYKKDRCSESKVCCKRSQLSSSTSLILPPPEPSLPTEPLPPKNVRGRPVTMEFTFKITWWR